MVREWDCETAAQVLSSKHPNVWNPDDIQRWERAKLMSMRKERGVVPCGSLSPYDVAWPNEFARLLGTIPWG
jgi:hypothetical protein